MHFDNSLPISYLIGLLLVWTIPILLDFKQHASHRRGLRLFLWTICIGSLTLYLLQPYTYSRLITEHAVIGKADQSFSKKTLHIDSAEVTSTLQRTSFGTLEIFSPLEAWQLELAQADSVIFHPKEAKGFRDFKMPRAYVGQPFSIEVELADADTLQVVLLLMNNALDSTLWWPGKDAAQLKTIPKTDGSFLYTLQAKRNGRVLYQEPLAVKVKKSANPSVLLLSSNPNFETKFFKNYLTEKGYRVATRTRISQDRYREEWINLSKKALTPISKSLLQDFHLVVIDASMMELLQSREKRQLEEQVENGSLAVLYLAESVPDIQAILKKTPLSVHSSVLNLDGNEPIDRFDIEGVGIAPITSFGQPIGYRWSTGIGKKAVATVPKMHTAALAGHQEQYHQLIYDLLQPLLPETEDDSFIQWPKIVRKNERTIVHFFTDEVNPNLTIDNEQTPFRETPFRPNDYEVVFWPNREGWMNLSLETGDQQQTNYVYASNDWRGLKIKQLNALNLDFAQSHADTEPIKPPRQKEALSSWWFMACGMLALAGLWIEQRFL